MMRSVVLLLVAWPLALGAQAAGDTTITARGIVQSKGLFLPSPLLVRGVRIGWLGFDGDTHGITTYENQFVEATGTLRFRTDTARAVIADPVDPRAKGRAPSGLVRRDLHVS